MIDFIVSVTIDHDDTSHGRMGASSAAEKEAELQQVKYINTAGLHSLSLAVLKYAVAMNLASFVDLCARLLPTLRPNCPSSMHCAHVRATCCVCSSVSTLMSNATLNQYKHAADGPVGSAEEQQLELAVNQLAEAVAVVAKTRFDWTEGRRALDNLVHQLNYMCVS